MNMIKSRKDNGPLTHCESNEHGMNVNVGR